MGKVITLLDVAQNLLALDPEPTIFAARPWTPDSPAMLVEDDDENGNSVTAAKEGMVYFIEVFIAQDFLSDWIREQQPSPSELCKYLICCALDDWSSVMPDLERGRSDIKK